MIRETTILDPSWEKTKEIYSLRSLKSFRIPGSRERRNQAMKDFPPPKIDQLDWDWIWKKLAEHCETDVESMRRHKTAQNKLLKRYLAYTLAVYYLASKRAICKNVGVNEPWFFRNTTNMSKREGQALFTQWITVMRELIYLSNSELRPKRGD